ncbi:MAG: nuclear transport factor 2 family protein [Candidatus Omnitrophica bacterium]|nr:nuclear transport factor 2 family protein [Candidatus Omnitrophota bacterium]MDD5352093.1 nuclear transport factor 2 family protein [Candidatus Omnitrophota bacterium]MDD5549691.1 nuclear transport factor 2 family protein [Candidatus Omnitrophota bacterium]
MLANQGIKMQINEVVQKFAEAFSERDANTLLGLFADDPDVTLIGSGIDEVRVGIKEIASQFDRDWMQSDGIKSQVKINNVSCAGNVAWTFGETKVQARMHNETVSYYARFTGVFERRKDKWLIMQWHISLPAYEQEEGESWPEKR